MAIPKGIMTQNLTRIKLNNGPVNLAKLAVPLSWSDPRDKFGAELKHVNTVRYKLIIIRMIARATRDIYKGPPLGPHPTTWAMRAPLLMNGFIIWSIK